MFAAKLLRAIRTLNVDIANADKALLALGNARLYSNNSTCTSPSPSDPSCYLPPSCMPPAPPKDPRVVIIGAGIAGLTAANHLMDHGICNVTVLEASDRAGGRIHSCWLGDTVVELGAQWVEGGCLSNSIFTLAAQEGLLGKPPLSRKDPCRTGLFHTTRGKPIDPCLGLAAAHAYRKIESDAYQLIHEKINKSDPTKTCLTMRSYVNERIMEVLRKFPEIQREDASKVMFGLSNETRFHIGDNLSAVSAPCLGSQMVLPGGDVRLPLGFIGIIAPLIRDLPEACVQYCKPVALVRWGTAGCDRAVVVTADGDECPADHVIVTVSLGVLKACASSLFCPALPAEKTEAIARAGFGRVGKLFLEYEKPFWGPGEGGLRLAWSSKELAARRPDGCDWARGISGFTEVPSSNSPKDPCCVYDPGSRVLEAQISGPEAEAMERADEECVAEVVTRLIRTFTGDPGIPPPIRILRTSWCSDPNFRGGYSYLPVGCEDDVNPMADLCRPLPCYDQGGGQDCVGPHPGVTDPILLFAGEATSADYYGTVHGARLSGLREAERIIEMTKRPPPEIQCPPASPKPIC
ncbi:spermine oxidase-like [Ischnura elegans]|uniref:spermine oxidase-like n=1 Tax=Ischnura elegans TaxID=197161 RepID=UPI001ED886CE|nr:spermine oxidase-like [Ischnura elegans]